MVNNLFEDLRDGTILISLLESLTNERFKRQKGNLVFHHRNNINTVLKVLVEQGVKLVNISSDDIEGGNPKLTLALIWLIALSFNGQKLVNTQASTSLEKNLLHWANKYTQKYDLRLLNFHSSWCDGSALLYILYETLPRDAVNLRHLLALPPIGRLQHAFTIAKSHLNIDQLLDPEDVHTTKPDKKSILMYVMSIYHALESHAGESHDKAIRDSDFSERTLAVSVSGQQPLNVSTIHCVENEIPVQSRPLSATASMEISGYQTAIEEVLALLLSSEEILSHDIPQFADLEQAKEKFKEHERFMFKLSQHQRYVGSALEEGAQLISESQFLGPNGLSPDEQNEIKQQMFLLNERWETLRIKAMEVQSQIHSKLAEVECRKMEDFRRFLTETEDRISRYASTKPGQINLDNHIDDLKNLRADLEDKQQLVDSLANVIVIVDDETQNFHDLEDKLAALGERWSHILEWTQKRWESVHVEKQQWNEIIVLYQRMMEWINTRERDLKEMESTEVNAMGEAIKRVNVLSYCATDVNLCTDQLAELDKKIQNMSQSHQCGLKLSQNVEDLTDRCEALKQIIDVQKSRLSQMGFEFIGNSVKPESWDDFQYDVPLIDMPSMTKKPKIEKTDKILDLELKIIDMLNFVDYISSSINDLNQSGMSTIDDLDSIRSILKDRIKEYADVKDLMDTCQSEGECSLEVAESQLEAIGSKYDEFVFHLEDVEKKIIVDKINKQFYNSLTGLKLVLAELKDWYRHSGHMATAEELITKTKHMDSLLPEITETKKLCENNTDAQFLVWRRDFDQFYNSWNDTQKAIQRMISENGSCTATEPNDTHLIIQSHLEYCNKSKIICSDITEMNDNLSRLYDLSDKLHIAETDNLGENLRSQVQNAVREVNNKIMSQSTIIENVNHFQKEKDYIIHEMDKIENVLTLDRSELVESDKFNEKYQKFGIEIKKLEIDIISLKNFCEIITTDDHSSYTDLVKDIVAKHKDLVEMYRDNKQRLKPCHAKANAITVQIEEIERWLTNLEKSSTPLRRIEAIPNSNELFQEKLKYQNLKDTCDLKSEQFKELNDNASEILIEVNEKDNKQIYTTDISNMVKALTKLNSHWNDITNEVYNSAATLERISGQLGEFHTLISQENGYFDKLQQILDKSLESAADAEEICEELDDLENIIRNHSGERLQKIEELGQDLIYSQFMADTMASDTLTIKNRWDDLRVKV